MHVNKPHSSENKAKAGLELEMDFRVILKFWRKSSINSDVRLRSSQCRSVEAFVEAVKAEFDIVSAHCLEEIWVLQQKGHDYEKILPWIKNIGGRIKIEIPLEYKEFLLRRASEGGARMFEDPLY